jgi:hypothetical protein
MKLYPPVCYLCGEALTPPVNADHVPPKQMYAKDVRLAHSPNLLTIQVHQRCNSAYQHDEDYFFNALAPYGTGSYSGSSFLNEVKSKYAAGKNQSLVHRVLDQFDRPAGSIFLPQHLSAQRIEGARIHRVAWKIVRGLYFHEHGVVLPESTPNHLEISPPDRPPPAVFLATLWDLDSCGAYPGVFDYKYVIVSEVKDLNYWGLLLWDRLILIMSFHSPNCDCETCLRSR